jgi:RhoGAP (GTPase activating protein)-like protein
MWFRWCTCRGLHHTSIACNMHMLLFTCSSGYVCSLRVAQSHLLLAYLPHSLTLCTSYLRSTQIVEHRGDTENMIQQYAALLGSLQPCAYQLLFYMLQFLEEVIAHSGHNLMTKGNIGIGKDHPPTHPPRSRSLHVLSCLMSTPATTHLPSQFSSPCALLGDVLLDVVFSV